MRQHQGIALRTAYLVAGDAADAQEAAQDAFVKAYRALGRFRRGAPFRPWLLRIVANEARNRRRSAGRRQALVLRAADAAPGDAAPSPEAALVSAERRASCWPRSAGLETTTGWCSPAATCSSCRRRRPRPRSASAAGPSSRGWPARSSGCGPSWRRRTMPELERELRALAATSSSRPSATSGRPSRRGSRRRSVRLAAARGRRRRDCRGGDRRRVRRAACARSDPALPRPRGRHDRPRRDAAAA